MNKQLQSALILLDNVFLGTKKFTRQSFQKKLEDEELSSSDSSITRLLHFIRQVFGVEIKFPKNGTVELVDELDSRHQFIRGLLLFGKIQNLGDKQLNQYISYSSDSYYKNSEYILQIYYALLNRQRIKITYQKFYTSEPETYVLKPKFIKEYLGRWYLVAEKENGDTRVFGIDRINQLETTASRFQPEPIPNTSVYKDTIGVNFSGPVKNVKLWVESYQLNLFETYPLHQSQQILSQNENGGELSLTVVINYEFIQLIASFLDRVIVLEPIEVKEQFLEKINSIKAKY